MSQLTIQLAMLVPFLIVFAIYVALIPGEPEQQQNTVTPIQEAENGQENGTISTPEANQSGQVTG